MQTTEPWFFSDMKMGASVNVKKSTNSAIEAGIRYHRRFYKTLALHAALNLPQWKVNVEPWFRTASYKLRSPDAVLLCEETKQAIVIEVKKNWADGRDVKLLDEYLPIVASAHGVRTYPLMVVGNVRGLKHRPFVSIADIIERPLAWKPGQPTPTLLKP
jgi:hypothetical protein